jgi:CheY-like chemotaxis protein
MGTILVVDDESTIRKLLQDILEDAGYVVAEATNGREGLAVLENQPIDLVVSDVMMPVMDGVGLCEAMQQHPTYQSIPLVLVSAVGIPRPAGSCQYAAFLTKPFDYDYLVTTIAQVLNERG